MAKEIEIIFNPIKNSEVDEVQFVISEKFRDFLKRVQASDQTVLMDIGDNQISRYLVKTFIRQNFQAFLILWNIELLQELSLKVTCTYSEYISIVKSFRDSDFTTLISEIGNYKRHNFQCDIDNLDDNTDNN